MSRDLYCEKTVNDSNLKPFQKGDKRINRKGRPKSFDALRALAITQETDGVSLTEMLNDIISHV